MRLRVTQPATAGLLCSLILLAAGCSNPSSQTLDSLTVTATPASVTVGSSVALKATAHLSDGTTQDVTANTSWTSSNPAIGSISNALLLTKAAGTVSVSGLYIMTAPASQSSSTAAAVQNLTSSAQVTITNASSGTAGGGTIAWAAPAPITYGTALSATQLNATASVAGTFVYSPAAGAVLTAGTQTLTTTFTPTDTTISASTASVQLTVNQATPTVTWPTPAPVQPGTALSAAQLDATANVPGAFTYTPAAGTVLSAGVQQLAAAFAPTDAVDYSAVTTQNSIAVGANSSPTPSPTPIGCGGPTINLNPGMSQSTMQSAITAAPKCALIVFAAGTYSVSGGMTIPCASNLTLTGPVATPATAILSANKTGSAIFGLGGCTGVTIEYLHFENTGGIYVAQGADSGITIVHNQFTNLPAGTSNPLSEAGVFFDGDVGYTLSNVVLEYNTFGDSQSCMSPTDVMDSVQDYSGYCAGYIDGTGVTTNMVVKYNTFNHVEEGLHHTAQGVFKPGTVGLTDDGLDVEYNYFVNVHRISAEIQSNVQNHATIFSNNSVVNPYYPFEGTLTISTPCCSYGLITSTTSNVAPALQDNNNLLITHATSYPPFGFEFWGNASQADNNLVQGTFANGIVWGYGIGAWQILNNTFCGTAIKYGGYIVNEEGTANAPTISGNVTVPTCNAVASVAPAISQTAGGITMTDPGYTSGPQPLGNTSIYYTTDGSTPVPGSGTTTLYTGPFTPATGATINAVGMWGVPPQPLSYDAGYGFVPSSVVTATYTAGSNVKGPKAKVSAIPVSTPAQGESGTQAAGSGPVTAAALESVAIAPSAPVLTIGGTTQLKAMATFSDGSTKDVTTDFAWQSSDPRTITASASGLVSGLASGQARLSGSYLGQQASVLASSAVGEIEWSGPIVITQGGTYSGNWQSTDPKSPAVTIATAEPIVIQDSHIRSSGNLIKVNISGADLTVRNSLGLALNVPVKGQPNGVFLDAASPARLDVENNYMENVRYGVFVHGYSGSRSESPTLIIRGNRARNLNGLLSDGMGGYLPGEGANSSPSRFVEFDNVQSVPGIDVGWNEVIDYPAHSLVSDVIDVYRSSGTPNRPLEVHDSYIQGAYPYKPAQDAYHGGGIKTDGSADDTAQTASAFTYVHDNQVVGTVSYGIAFSAGHDNVAANNRVISSGLLADGTKIAAQQVGLSNADAQGNMDRGSTFNNTMHDNLIGWTCWSSSCAGEGYRHDQYFPASPGDYVSNSLVSAKQITLQMEESEYLLWLNKTAAAGIKVGPSF